MSNIPRLFDHKLLADRRARALERYGHEGAFLLNEVTNDMLERLAMVLRPFPLCAELGGHTDQLANTLAKRDGTQSVLRLEQHVSLLSPSHPSALFDLEFLPLKPHNFNLVVSPLFLHWAHDLPGILAQIRHSLVPDGLFLATVLGRDSLSELRAVFLEAESELTGGATPRIAPLPDLKDLGALLQRAGFALPVADQDNIMVRYDSMFDLIRDLRQMGATNVLHERSRTFLRRDVLMRAAELYQQRFADPDERIRATFKIVSLSGWAPHESQQKPLKPGSAKQPLSAVLADKSSVTN